ncbi:response regulator, partial [bacterium]|nr:response regulator [bacterium]
MAKSENLEYLWEQLQYLGRDRYAGFEQLIRKRVRNILLVASHYDAFTLEGGGRLTELLLSEYRELNLSSAPRITRANSGNDAMDMIHAYKYDLVITMTRIGEMHPVELARRVKSVHKKLPVMVLGYNERELARIDAVPDHPVDMSFVWTGDVKLLVAIIKMVEDRLNVADDTRNGDVRVIIVVEDSVRFYSSYLPLIYKEIMNRTQELMADGINLSQKLLRMRARPKILFATTFEEAWGLYVKYRKYILGAICDARFSRDGEDASDAGLEFIKLLRSDDPELPVVLQSSEDTNRELAEKAGVGYINKHSVKLHRELRYFMQNELGFGDFVFRLEDGTEVARASNTRELEKLLSKVPNESVMYHAKHDHYSNWLRARTKFTLASMIKPVKASEFSDADDLRNFLIDSLQTYRRQLQSGVVLDFSRKNFDSNAGF